MKIQDNIRLTIFEEISTFQLMILEGLN